MPCRAVAGTLPGEVEVRFRGQERRADDYESRSLPRLDSIVNGVEMTNDSILNGVRMTEMID